MNCVLQVELFSQSREIVGIGVDLVTIPGLRGTAVTAPVVRNDPIALLAEVQHLSVPLVRSERPAVTEHDGLAFSPVLVVNVRAVFCRDRRHKMLSLVLTSVVTLPWNCRGFRQGKPYLKTRVTRLRIDLNVAPVFFQNALNR